MFTTLACFAVSGPRELAIIDAAMNSKLDE